MRALAAAGVLALTGALGTASASAAEEPGEQCAGATAIEGQGSSSQRIAQRVWAEKLVAGKGFNESTNGSACSGTQGSGSKPTVKYLSSDSAAGKMAWGAEKAGNKPKDGKKENPAESGDGFIAVNEPPTPEQMEHIDEAAGAGAKGSGQTLVIPVAQEAVAVIVNPPADCLITKITNANLQEIWNGTISEWSGVTGGAADGAGVTEDVAGACKAKIIRDVRHDSSGTTYVFKLYLSEINNTTCAGGTDTWTFYAELPHNLEWPQTPSGTCVGKVVVSSKTGALGEVEEVEKTSGAIGYADLADARSVFTDETGDHYHWLGVQNQRVTKFYPLPGTSTGEPSLIAGEANCKKTHYTNLPIKVESDDDWSRVGGAHPGNVVGLQNENYPICDLAYDVALASYELAGFATPLAVSKTVYDYLNYVVAPGGGQTDVVAHDYLEVEEAVGAFSREEALLIAAGVDVSMTATAGTLSFDAAEDISLLLFAKTPEKIVVTFTVLGIAPAGREWEPKLILLPKAGLFSLVKDGCSGSKVALGAGCKVEIESLKTGLELLYDGLRPILHLETP